MIEEDLIILRKLAEQEKYQRAVETKNRILKPTHAIKLAEIISPMIKKLDVIIESTKNLGEIVEKSDDEDENTQTTAIQSKTGTQSLRDTLTLMKRSKIFYKLAEKSNGDVFCNGVFNQPFGEKKIYVKIEEYDITPNTQKNFTNTKVTNESLMKAKEYLIYLIRLGSMIRNIQKD